MLVIVKIQAEDRVHQQSEHKTGKIYNANKKNELKENLNEKHPTVGQYILHKIMDTIT